MARPGAAGRISLSFRACSNGWTCRTICGKLPTANASARTGSCEATSIGQSGGAVSEGAVPEGPDTDGFIVRLVGLARPQVPDRGQCLIPGQGWLDGLHRSSVERDHFAGRVGRNQPGRLVGRPLLEVAGHQVGNGGLYGCSVVIGG